MQSSMPCTGEGLLRPGAVPALPPVLPDRVTDQYNYRVQKFGPTGRFLSSFGARGRTAGRFQQPLGIALLPAPAGVAGGPRVAVSDSTLNNVQLFDPTL